MVSYISLVNITKQSKNREMNFTHFTLHLLLLLLSCLLCSSTKIHSREAIEAVVGRGISIGIGIGGSSPNPSPSPSSSPNNCPPPPPQQPPAPPPLIFLDERLAVVYPVIQTFKKLITSDPFNVTATWVGSDICSYKGFFCESPPDNQSATALASIDFNGFQLSAPSLDGFLDKLPDLALFHANSNFFAGTISPRIANLRYLYELDISNNKLTGQFPPALLMPNNITFLDIRYNLFSGSVPSQIFMKPLDVLFINNNNFIQSLPESLGATTVLYLTLANNNFSGPIPRSIGQASSTLLEILLLNNRLSGCLPYEIGYLKQLTVFDVGFNQLTGPIPCSFACLDKLEQLNLAGNMFYGAVPELLCMVTSVTNLSLSDNYFTFVGPFCKALVKQGVLDLRNNCVLGLPFQRSALECANFFSHPRGCGHPSWFTFVPCKVQHNWGRSGGSGVRDDRPLRGNFGKMRSPSYAALEKHRT
ncbi:hypothetical protein Sjap_017337 [Stephania japonica]|uniref:Leucine-rich repeat-containing N-terminal plant-type domain-containing protein n=1 Tax=Stephania japonica TaxID=461633 RepID=A0AAP0I5Y6_9MAGN